MPFPELPGFMETLHMLSAVLNPFDQF